MRSLVLFACLAALAATVVGAASAAGPDAGTLSVERGKGVVVLDLRGSILGRLTSGTLRVTDQTPLDRFTATVVGRRVTQERLGPRTVLYRGQGLRFRMLGGGYRIVVRGVGIDISAVGKGLAILDGEPRTAFDDVGLYSLDGVDCGLEPDRCSPLPLEPTRLVVGPPDEGRSSGKLSP